MKKECEKKDEERKLIEKDKKQREAENNRLINDLSDENKRLSNEKELYKKLFQEEKEMRVNSIANGTNSNENQYLDFDNLTDNDLSDEEETWAQVKTRKRRYKCNKCNFTSVNNNKVTQHEALHDKILKCDKCVFKTKRKNELINHNKIHTTQMIKCEQCDYVANFKNILAEHIKVKHEGRILNCDKCSYKTPFHNVLKKHSIKCT